MQLITNFAEYLRGKHDVEITFGGRLYKIDDATGQPKQALRKKWGYYPPERKKFDMRKVDVPEFLTTVRQVAYENKIESIESEADQLKELQSSAGEDQDVVAIGNRRSILSRRAAFLRAMSPTNGKPIR